MQERFGARWTPLMILVNLIVVAGIVGLLWSIFGADALVWWQRWLIGYVSLAVAGGLSWQVTVEEPENRQNA